MDVSILTNLATKYKALLLDNPEVFILVFALGCGVAWFIVRTHVENAKSEIAVLERHVAMNREHAEHYKARLDALELQQLRTYTPAGFEENKPDDKGH